MPFVLAFANTAPTFEVPMSKPAIMLSIHLLPPSGSSAVQTTKFNNKFQRGCTFSFIFVKLFCGFPLYIEQVAPYCGEVLEQPGLEGNHRRQVYGHTQPVPYIGQRRRQNGIAKEPGNKNVAVKALLKRCPYPPEHRVQGCQDSNRQVGRVRHRDIIRNKQSQQNSQCKSYKRYYHFTHLLYLSLHI